MSSLSDTSLSSLNYHSRKSLREFDHPKKITICLFGRFARENEDEYPCRLQEISLYEISLLSPIQVKEGETLLCLIDHVGFLKGKVERLIDRGFILSIHLTPWGRKLLAARINKLISPNNSLLIYCDQQDTFHGPSSWTEITANNIKYKCRVEDLWLFGATLLTEAKPPLNSEIFLNRIRSRVEEHHADGITVSFTNSKTTKAFHRHFQKEIN